MAKDTYEYGGSKFGDGLDFQDRGETKPRGSFGKTRKAVSEFSTSAYDSAFMDFKDMDKWEKAFVAELPPQHKFVYDSYQQARRTGEELYDQFTKETRPILGEISKKLDSMVPQDSIFKAMTQKMKDKFWDAPPVGPDQTALDNQALQQMMNETLGGLDMMAAQRANEAEKKQTARSITEQKIGQEQHQDLIAVLSPIQQSLSRLETFALNVGSQISKKQLEISFRSYMLQGRGYEHARKSHLEMMDQFKAMVANTALPDYAKIERTERFKEMMRDRAMGGLQNALFGSGSAVGQLMDGFKKDLQQGISAFTTALQGAASGIDMAETYFGKDSGMTFFESLGMMAGGEIGGRARKAIVNPIMKRLNANSEFQRKGFNAAQLVRDPRLILDLLQNNDKYKDMMDGPHGMKLQDLLKSMGRHLDPKFTMSKFGMGTGELNKPGILTNKAIIAQTDVMPGYMARILQQVTMFNTKKFVPLTKYDYGSNSFRDVGSIAFDINRAAREYNEKSSYTNSARARSTEMLAELGLKDTDEESLAAVLSMMARSKTAITGGRIQNFDGWDNATPGERRILELINSKAGWNKDEKTSGTMYKLRTHADELRGLGDNMTSFINKLVDEGHADLLVEEGLIELDPDNPGRYRTVGEKLEKLQRNAIYRVKSDVNAKSGVRRIDKNRALNGIRKTPVSSWNYKGGKKQYTGPMAQDVNRNLGENAAPGGTELDLVTMNGMTMAAIQKLSESQEKMIQHDGSIGLLKRIANAVGAGDKGAIADPTMALVDYARLAANGIARTNELLQNKTLFGGIGLPGFDTKAGKEAMEKMMANGKKFVDPLIRTGNKYIDGLQSALFSAVQDGFEGVKTIHEKGKIGLKSAKSTFIDKPFGFVMDVLMRNEPLIKDRAEFIYKKSVEAAGKAIDFGTSLFTEKIPAAVQTARNFLTNLKEGAKRIVNPPRDVYLKGEKEPCLTGERMRAGAYIDEEGKVIRGIDDLLTAKGSIIDIHKDGVVLKATDLADGVYDQEGRLLKTTMSLGYGLLAAGANLAAKGASKAYEWLTSGSSILEKGKAALSQVKSGIGSFFSNGMYLPGLGTDPKLLRLTAQIRDLLAIGKPKRFVTQIYNRDLNKHPLEGKDFLASMYGEKFVNRLFGGANNSNQGGGGQGGGGNNSQNPNFVGPPAPPGSNIPHANGPGGGWLQTFQAGVNGYNPQLSMGQNIANGWNHLSGNTSAQTQAAMGNLKNAVQGSKTFGFLQNLYNRGSNPNANFVGPHMPFVGPTRPGFFNRGLMGRMRNRGQGFLGGMRNRATNSWNNVSGIFNNGVNGQGFVPVAKGTGFFGGLKSRATNLAGRTVGGLGRLTGLARGFGIPGMIGSALGGMFGGNSQGNELQTAGTADLHQDNGPSNTTMVRENTTGKAVVGDSDGDGIRDAGASVMLQRQDEERRKQQQAENDRARESQDKAAALMETRKYKEDDFLQKLLAGASSLFGLLGGGFKGVFRMLGGAGKMLGGILSGGAKIARGAVSATGAAIRGAGGMIAKSGVMSVATRALGGVALAGAASGSMVGTALGAAAFAARIALGPYGLAAMAAWYVGKKIYKYATRNSTDDFGRVRMAQYGLGEENKDHYSKFLALEEYLKEHVSWQGDSPYLNSRSLKNEEILEIFDITKDDQDRATALGDWFENRFKPFFLNALASARWANPKARYFDVSKFTPQEMEKLCSRLDYAQGPYDAQTSPIVEVPTLGNTYAEVKTLIEKLRTSAKGKVTIKDNALENGAIATLKKAQDAKKATDAQNAAVDEKKKAADAEASSAERDKRKAEEERARLLGASNTRNEAAQRALMAVQAASEGRNFASQYRDETNKILGGGGPAVSDDGGKAPTVPQERSDGVLGMSGIPSAGGPLADPSKGLEGIIMGRGVNIEKMNPAVKQMFMAMAADYYKATGKKIRVADGWRDSKEQARLYATLPRGRAAKPGSSLHEFGAALDISPEDAEQLEKLGLMRKYGFTRPVGGEPWHLEPAGIQGQLDRAKRDPAFLSEMMMNSAGRGGGGIAMLSNVRKYSRNDAYAMKIYGEGSSIQVELPKPAANDASMKGPIISGTNQPVPTAGGTGGDSGPRTQNRLSGVNIIGGRAANDSPIPDSKPTPSAAGAGRGVINPLAANSAGGGRGFVNPGMEGENKPTGGPGGKGEATGSIKDQIGIYAKEAGGDPAFMQMMAGIESSMGTNMKPHTGSAQGPFQFMPATWQEQLKKHGKKYGLDPSASPFDLRASTLLATEMFTESTAKVKAIRGDRYDIVDGYFTHMLGRGGAATFARLKDNDIAADALPAAAKANYNVFYDKSGRALTAAEVRAKQMQKMQNVANTYGVNITPLIAGWNKEAGDKPGLQNDFNGDSSPRVQAGNPTARATASVSTSAGMAQNNELGEYTRNSSVTAANDARKAEQSRPRVEADQRGVSNVRETSAGNVRYQETMQKLAEESRDHLSTISTTLNDIRSLFGEKGTPTAQGQAAAATPSPSVSQRPVQVTPVLDRNRKYG